MDQQQLLLKLKHEPRPLHEAIEADYQAQAKARPLRRPIGLDAPTALGDGIAAELSAELRRLKRRCAQTCLALNCIVA